MRAAALALVALVALVVPGCRSFEREIALKRASVAEVPKELRSRFDQLVPFGLARCVKLRPSAHKVGSGCIMSPDGWIITAEHVVRGESAVEVVLEDGVSLAGRVMAIAPGNDYALLKVEAKNLPYFRFGARPKLGQWVIALGAAYRVGREDDAGSVSAGRCIYPQVRIPGDMGTYYYDAVFHSAPIFPGDSGGALMDLDGKLVGVHGGFAADKASVAPSIEQITQRIRRADGRIDPYGAVRGRALPVQWPAMRPRDFDESSRWTNTSVSESLVQIYAPRDRRFVEDLLARTRKRYLALRAQDARTDDELVRAMLSDVFDALRARQNQPAQATAGAKPTPRGRRGRRRGGDRARSSTQTKRGKRADPLPAPCVCDRRSLA